LPVFKVFYVQAFLDIFRSANDDYFDTAKVHVEDVAEIFVHLVKHCEEAKQIKNKSCYLILFFQHVWYNFFCRVNVLSVTFYPVSDCGERGQLSGATIPASEEAVSNPQRPLAGSAALCKVSINEILKTSNITIVQQ
jgi:hypothetical protein